MVLDKKKPAKWILKADKSYYYMNGDTTLYRIGKKEGVWWGIYEVIDNTTPDSTISVSHALWMAMNYVEQWCFDKYGIRPIWPRHYERG